MAGVANADTAPSPRSATNVVNVSASPRSDSNRVVRVSAGADVQSKNSSVANGAGVTGRASGDTVARSSVRRTTTNTSNVSRSAVAQPVVRNAPTTARSGTIRQTVVGGNNAARSATTSRAASSNVVRSATHNPASTARAASNQSVVGASRSSMARATAVFNDISKIGGGYAACREAYATCMDQFCANANDTYRRCICSAKYTDIRNTENAIDQALTMLAQFEDNNLAAVELSAEEVSAMYSATEGEAAIKRDTSAAAQMLSEIDDLLAGRSTSSSSSTSTNNDSTSLGILSVDFTSDLDDIWSNTGSSIFDTQDTGVDLASLEGQELYNQVNAQCLELIADSCENEAVLTMARSAYSIMITQDCNTYQKRVDAQTETLKNTVRTAEKYLREARLEEYRAHNSADVNECITAVRTAILGDMACGPNYEKCLDYTGAYFNSTTGEPIYSPRLFEAVNLIKLPGLSSEEGDADDIIGSNADFNEFLDSKRIYAESALDTCRDLSDIVWDEFKRQAIIEIAQAQDDKIEEVKMSCVSTMAECYDTQSGQLKDMDTTTSQYAGAISAAAAREMCKDQVIACASLYGDTDGCKFDGNGRLVDGTGNRGAANDRCGLTELLAFVDTVDTVRVAEGCETAIENYLTEICTPPSGELGYPFQCALMSMGELETQINTFADQNCTSFLDSDLNNDENSTINVDTKITNAIESIKDELDYQLMDLCESTYEGYWLSPGDRGFEGAALQQAFYSGVYGGNKNADELSWGKCVQNNTRISCENYNDADKDPVASYDQTLDQCDFTDEWFEAKCSLLGGYFENSVCYTPPITNN